MNTHYLYLFLNLVSVGFPLLFSFYKKANFSKKWKYVLPAIVITAIPFIIWDECFTRAGIWGFNAEYITGIYIFSLPIEEVLFFICIPYACVFIYFSLQHLVKTDHFLKYQNIISYGLIILLTMVGFTHLDRWYTATTSLLSALLLLLLVILVRPDYLGRFYFSFLFMLFPFFLVNGVLTGTLIESPVVWYNNAETLGLRWGTIPIEDVSYALILILGNIALSEKLERKLTSEKILSKTS